MENMVSREVSDLYATPMEQSNVRTVLRLKLPKKYAKIKTKLLESLNPLEVDIYILLLEGDAKRLIEIADLIGLDRTETYQLVSALQNKGLVTAAFKHPIKFTAVQPHKAFKILSKTK